MKRGFTLIELLVVISIISMLSSIVFASLRSAQDKAKLARAKQDIQSIQIAMFVYQGDVGELPPQGDSCNTWYCGGSPATAAWTAVIDALRTNDGSPGWNGPYLTGRIDTDPWGSYYGYDDNDRGSGQWGDSILYTAGG